ncbi:hypothetical protein, partial [Lactobacillus crispatus]|uniref:hypothetical protein n=1 Tax=Lactobacillus crispatus TaxID=47770 RepID=UPI00105C5E5B
NKYCQRRWLKGRFLLLKILKRTKKRSRFLKKEILIVFIHLEASFFPDTFFTCIYLKICLFAFYIHADKFRMNAHELHFWQSITP